MPENTITRSSSQRQYAAVLDQCRDTALVYFDTQMTELLQNAGAALLDFAERAESNGVQSRFFEAMGQLTRRRSDIEHIFRQEINLGFDQLGKPAPLTQDPSVHPDSDGIELSLVGPEEMEESVAAENLVLRANASYFPDLYALSQRLAAAIGGKKLKDFEIPAGPHHLVDAFRHAIEGLDVEVRIKIVLYALFDKFVLKKARPIYTEYNAILIAGGVLPNLKPVHVRQAEERASQRRSAAEANAETAAQGAVGDDQEEAKGLGSELFITILDLMSANRPGRGGGIPKSGPSNPVESQAQTRELLSAINSLQANQNTEFVSTAVAESTEFPNVEIDSGFITRVKEALSQEREQVLGSIDRDKLSPMDADLIDLIGMLFEYMLNDPVLPNVAKALLSHLHTPYLKVALIDRRLLVDSRHPARRLLDQMVEAGSQWVEEGNPSRGMFPAMQQIVDRVLQELTDDVGLFDEILSFFDDKMREQQRRSDTMEQRTQEAVRGREKLALAKQRAAREIQGLVGLSPVPRSVAGFLSKTWMDHLVFILLRDEEQERGPTWKHAVAVAEQLVALFDPRTSPETHRLRIAAIPTLRQDIMTTAQRMGGFNSATVDALIALLDAPQNWQAQDLERPQLAMSPTPGQAVASAGPPTLSTSTSGDEDLPDAERQMVERLRRMRFGTWLEFSGTDSGAPPRRIKLSWMSPLTSTCMFVDRAGMQAEIKSLRDLAQEILAGRARVIPRPKHPFIDRALVSIRKMLQGDAAAPPAAPPP
ncbi:MAG TPA: DUF1631 domain-containing protein [Lamprocystis sp. (in: g-proteobacteria)]|nr:DUF1631 domain-containing protein [Lamprocystis sp. (in: g-proteobacteria)]